MAVSVSSFILIHLKNINIYVQSQLLICRWQCIALSNYIQFVCVCVEADPQLVKCKKHEMEWNVFIYFKMASIYEHDDI